MIGKTLNYISHHAIAILALVCSLLALAGASYAATQLPKNSVGNAQIKQGAVRRRSSRSRSAATCGCTRWSTRTASCMYSSPQAKLTNWGDSSQHGRVQLRDDLVEADRRGEAVLRAFATTAGRPPRDAELGDGRRAEPARHHWHACLRRLDRLTRLIAVEVVC